MDYGILKSQLYIYIHKMSVLPLPPIHKGKKFVVLSDWVSLTSLKGPS